MMRFANGYVLFTNDANSSGVSVSAGGGSWSSVSDRRKKENFMPLDMETILNKVSALPITKWNYKSQPVTQKHIGPMAQDFYAAFQLDGIGNDTTINTMDIEGVNMIAIQALEKRTKEQAAEIKELKAALADQNKENTALKTALTEKNKSIITRLESLEASLNEKDKAITVK